MYFKRLEIIGFKSFAEKTVLNFEPGVSAVVGPNGCGKSNIADSIRWVLGEQSTKAMRASSMQDVIFNGTDTKEPINYAEVSLTLSNDKRVLPIDYDEVTITRRIFRSGENEYLLNKTPVRLKDISELLMGTGIGTESYSIIEQGKMDLILSSRPEDRRYVFEEASGITKYKSKKKEALRKLEETEHNLVRINDIIQEVKRQITSIERQARRAEKYAVELEKLKDLELKISSYEYRALRSDDKAACAERDDLKAREQECVESVHQMGEQISRLKCLVESAQMKIAEFSSRNTEVLSTVDKNTHKVEIDRERMREMEALSEGLSREIEVLTEKIARQKELVEKERAELERIARDKEAKEKASREKEARVEELVREIDGAEKAIERDKLEMLELLARETHARNELIKLGTELANRSARERRLASEKEMVLQELAQEEARLEDVRNESGLLTKRLADATERLLALRREGESSDIAITQLEEDLMRARSEEASFRSKVELLEDLIKKHEGFSVGVKSILSKMHEDAVRFPGVLGVVADVIDVERGYEEAVNAVLGDDVQTIVVKTLQDAITAISFLRESKLGRANFVSLEELRRMGSRVPAAPHQGTMMPLVDHVKVDGAFRELAEYFFGDAYIVESIEDAARSSGVHSRLVTKTGICLERGRLSGGSVGDREEFLLIGRRERLKVMSAELQATLERIAHMESGKERVVCSAREVAQKIKEQEDVFRQEEIAFANIASKKESHEANARKMREELSVLDLELDDTKDAIANLKSKEESLRAEADTCAEAHSRFQARVEENQDKVTQGKQEKEQAGLLLASLTSERASLEKELERVRTSLSKEEALATEQQETISSKETLWKDSLKRREEFAGEIVTLEAENIALSKDLGLFEEEHAALAAERSRLAEALAREEAQRTDREKLVENLRNQIRDVEMRIMDLNYKKAALKERISGAYKVDLDLARIETEEGADWESIRCAIQELKTKLDEMGPVNLVAIEEHKEMEERFAFLTHQQSDLINAKESLHKAIQKINKTTKELFIDVFQKIQLEFKNFFRLLFGGGQAELLLIDDQDVLESGIEIVARPPGKKLQNISLLSGGEKALTAIALLFAVFKVKPSPFCVLDEIDAPLDESNIDRFSRVLAEFLKMSQFIIITHNKKTIELSDVMYGITMQERGVSKIVSVKFLANEKEQEQGKEALAAPA